MRERIPSPRIEKPIDTSEIAEWLDTEPDEVRGLFKQLPRQLWSRHYQALEDLAAKNPAQDPISQVRGKVGYLANIVSARKAGLEEFKSEDVNFQELMSDPKLGERLQGLLESPDDMLGAGQTAQVKRLALSGKDVAVKYLLTPTEQTRTAEGEHDMLWEVETVTHIEEEENKAGIGKRIRVPHPYFFYKNDKLQCYGMKEVRGRNIEQLVRGGASAEGSVQPEAIWSALRQRYADPKEQESLFAELDSFSDAMHKVCLHGDIKLANMMVDEEGTIYLIDFGQSVDTNSMTDKTREQFENLQVLERNQIKHCVRSLLSGFEDQQAAA